MSGKSQEAAAAAAGMSVRTARKWEWGLFPSGSKKPRSWRTRPDPFEGVWDEEIVPLLVRDEAGILQATTLLELLEGRYPGRFGPAQLRTLQRRMRDWRAVQGPDREVYFEQVHPPGREGQLDFTHATELGVRIAGAPFEHLLFEFVLSFSGWRWVGLAYGETFEALVEGLQGALWALGGAPEIVRSDNLSAATHELKRSGGRALTERFAAVLAHYGLRSTRIHPGRSHENGVAEQAHYRLKSALAQALVIRGSRDFDAIAAYEAFVQEVVERLNRPRLARLAEERPHLRPLPTSRVPAYTIYRAKVRKWSTIRISNKTYSVPSRLRGHTVEVRQFADVLEVLYQGTVVERMPRLRGGREHRIDYRHVIWVFGFSCSDLQTEEGRVLQLETESVHLFIVEASELDPDSVRRQHVSFEVAELGPVAQELDLRGEAYATGQYTGFRSRNYRWIEWRDPVGIRVECVEPVGT
jgi:transposase InsO family protein